MKNCNSCNYRTSRCLEYCERRKTLLRRLRRFDMIMLVNALLFFIITLYTKVYYENSLSISFKCKFTIYGVLSIILAIATYFMEYYIIIDNPIKLTQSMTHTKAINNNLLAKFQQQLKSFVDIKKQLDRKFYNLEFLKKTLSSIYNKLIIISGKIEESSSISFDIQMLIEVYMGEFLRISEVFAKSEDSYRDKNLEEYEKLLQSIDLFLQRIISERDSSNIIDMIALRNLIK